MAEEFALVSDSITLLPCAHCGSPPTVRSVQTGANSTDRAKFIQCSNPQCGISGPLTYARVVDLAMASVWNRRTQPLPTISASHLKDRYMGGK